MYEGRPHTNGDLHICVRGQRSTFTPPRPSPVNEKDNNSEKRTCENPVAVTDCIEMHFSIPNFYVLPPPGAENKASTSGVGKPPPLVAVLTRRASSCRNVSRPRSSRDRPLSVAITGREGGAARLANTKQSRRQRTAWDTNIWMMHQLLYREWF